VDALPNGPSNHPTVRVFLAGGVPEVMLHLRELGLLDLDCLTVAGATALSAASSVLIQKLRVQSWKVAGKKSFSAVSAGAKADKPVADMFWGDRCGLLTDPFGHKWNLATRKENLTPEEIRKRGKAFFDQMAMQAR